MERRRLAGRISADPDTTFDKDGIMKTGWLDSDDGKYYLGADGKAFYRLAGY